MSEYARFLAMKEVRDAPTDAPKAVELHKITRKGKRWIATALQMAPSTVARVIKAHREGREIGKNGRPNKVSEEDRLELSRRMEELIKEHRSPSKRKVASTVRAFILLVVGSYSNLVTHSR